MLSAANNELITRVGPGTPMGELFRRYWLPAVIADELIVDGSAVRLRILGENLLAFRNSDGVVGIIEPYCAHKLAPLYFGRNEECGLRCTYHGWKFDVSGRCVDMPNEPAGSTYKDEIQLTAYPTQEWGGMIWIYMGPNEPGRELPQLPQLEWARVDDDQRHLTRWLQRSNWCQGVEGEFDNSHVSFLHSWQDMTHFPNYLKEVIEAAQFDGAPNIEVQETDYGFITGSRRRSTDPDQHHWMMAQWMMPTYSLVGNPGWPQGGRVWVPIDDYHTTTFAFAYHGERPLSESEITSLESGVAFPPRLKQGTFKLPDGYLIDTFLPDANRENNYLRDAEIQERVNFTGIYGANEQDRSVQENMPSVEGAQVGALVDRTREHLVATDLPGVTLRRRMIREAKKLQQGEEPSLPHLGDLYHVRSPGQRLSSIESFAELLDDSAAADAKAVV